MEQAKSTTLDFEASLKELEKIVRELESGDVNLDESLKKFEQGIELYKNCRSTLENAEKKIKILSDSLKELEYKE
jgi:exodeoxyribonuclease VII small subunit